MWRRIATRTGSSVRQAKKETTSTDLFKWVAFFEEEEDRPDRLVLQVARLCHLVDCLVAWLSDRKPMGEDELLVKFVRKEPAAAEMSDDQKKAMIGAIKEFFPAGVQCTNPEGGMFLWVTLPEGVSSMRLFEAAIAKKVAFVPGTPFYVDRKDTNTLRLNFSCSDEPSIVEGIRRLGDSIKQLI